MLTPEQLVALQVIAGVQAAVALFMGVQACRGRRSQPLSDCQRQESE